MKSGLGIFFLLFIGIGANAQEAGIKLTETNTIKQLSDYFVQYNLRRTEFPGWRIQVFATNDRREMENTLSQFKGRFPQYRAKWILNDPYYQIRAGIFVDQAEALRGLQEIRRNYRSATIISDRIRREELMDIMTARN